MKRDDADAHLGSALVPIEQDIASKPQGDAIVVYDRVQDNSAVDVLDLRGLWKIIRRYRWTILTVLAVIMIATLVATLLSRPVYRAEALLKVNAGSSSTMVKFQTLEQGETPTREHMATQSSVLKSASVASAVIDELKLHEEPELIGTLQQRGFVSGLQRLVALARSAFAPDTKEIVGAEIIANEAILKRFAQRLRVRTLPDATVFKITFDSFDPVLASNIANSVFNNFVSVTNQERFNSTSGAKAYLESEIAKVQARVETSEKQLTEYARKNKIVDVEDKGNIMTSRLVDLSTRLTSIQADRIAAESELRQADAGNVNSLPIVLAEPLVKELKKDLALLENEYSELAGVYKEDYPALKQLKQKIDKQRAAIQEETSKITDGLRVSFEQLTDNEKQLEAALAAQNNALLDLQDRSVQYNILKREWETNKELYSGLLERMKEVGVAAGMEFDSISLIDSAAVPTSPYRPRLAFNLAVAAIGGLLAGIGLALLIGYLDNRIRSPEDLEEVANVVSLGMVPKVAVEQLEEGSEIDLIAHHDRENEASEAFRSVRTSLMFSSPAGAPQTLLVTSAAASEGKSVTAANLALVLSQNDSRVLLVDADLRKPRLHKIFSIPSSPGLSEYLVQSVDLNVIRQTELPTLDLLTSGTAPPNPAELIGSPRMDEFLSSVREYYDHIIVDAPPVLGLADAVIIGTKMDGVMLVVSANQVTKDAVRESVKRLRMVHAPLVGAVLNQVDHDDNGYGYYNQYYYNYGKS